MGRGTCAWALVGLLTAGSARAADVAMGIGAGVVADLPDRASAGATRFGVGPSVVVPVAITPVPYLRLRIDLRLEQATGVDQLTWTRTTDGLDERVEDADEHTAFLFGVGLLAGVDGVLPVAGRVQPHLGVSVGALGVGVFHALRGTSLVLLDPDANDLGNPRNIDPYTLQIAPVVMGRLGLVARLGDRVDLWVETGYSSAFVGPRPLVKAPPELDARRQAFAWNPIVGAVGIWVRL